MGVICGHLGHFFPFTVRLFCFSVSSYLSLYQTPMLVFVFQNVIFFKKKAFHLSVTLTCDVESQKVNRL